MQPVPSASDPPPSSDTRPLTQPLLTPAEVLFHTTLENLAQQRCHIQCKPRLNDVLLNESLAGFHKICQRHIDFLVYRKEDWMPMLAIELDEDDSLDKTDRKKRQQLVSDVLDSTGIPLLSIHASEIEQVETIAQKLTDAWLQRAAALESAPPVVLHDPRFKPPTELLMTAASTTRPVKSPARLSLF